jgi:hypothetical protein
VPSPPAATTASCARAASRAAPVREAVAAIVRDRPAGRPLREAVVVPAALHHEIGDDAVEDRPVVGTVTHVPEEVLGRQRCAHGVYLDDEVAGRGLEAHARGEGRRRGGGRLLRRGRKRGGQGEDEGGEASHGDLLRAILAQPPREAARPIP